jgi:hypothetical protein
MCAQGQLKPIAEAVQQQCKHDVLSGRALRRLAQTAQRRGTQAQFADVLKLQLV